MSAPIGFVVVDQKTKEIDWDCELHPNEEAAISSLTGSAQMYCQDPSEETEERIFWGRHYMICPVHPPAS